MRSYFFSCQISNWFTQNFMRNYPHNTAWYDFSSFKAIFGGLIGKLHYIISIPPLPNFNGISVLQLLLLYFLSFKKKGVDGFALNNFVGWFLGCAIDAAKHRVVTRNDRKRQGYVIICRSPQCHHLTRQFKCRLEDLVRLGSHYQSCWPEHYLLTWWPAGGEQGGIEADWGRFLCCGCQRCWWGRRHIRRVDQCALEIRIWRRRHVYPRPDLNSFDLDHFRERRCRSSWHNKWLLCEQRLAEIRLFGIFIAAVVSGCSFWIGLQRFIISVAEGLAGGIAISRALGKRLRDYLVEFLNNGRRK